MNWSAADWQCEKVGMLITRTPTAGFVLQYRFLPAGERVYYVDGPRFEIETRDDAIVTASAEDFLTQVRSTKDTDDFLRLAGHHLDPDVLRAYSPILTKLYLMRRFYQAVRDIPFPPPTFFRQQTPLPVLSLADALAKSATIVRPLAAFYSGGIPREDHPSPPIFKFLRADGDGAIAWRIAEFFAEGETQDGE
jgi:hypothetical protein